MPTAHTTPQILLAVLDEMAHGHGFTRHGAVVHFDSTVLIGQTRYHVVVDWPDGAEIRDLAPLVEEKAYTVLLRSPEGDWEPREADLTLAQAQRVAKECHILHRAEVLIAPTTEDHRSLIACGDCR